MFPDARVALPSLVLLLSISVAPAHVSAAQDPIRVRSDEVLVPTVVFDKELYAKLNKMKAHHRDSYGHLVTKDEKLWDSVAVKNLTAKDFHLYEDGQEKTVHSVKLELPTFRVVTDNLGKHPEIIGSGGGVWAYPDRPATDLTVWLPWPQYVLAYIPPKSAPGSCHQIQVKVEHANLVVWTRSEYCNTMHSATDPLNGTEFGKKLEAALRSTSNGHLDLSLNVAVFADNPDGARVHVTMGFPWQSLAHEFRDDTLYATIGTLVMVYKKDGTLAERYSDFACCDYGNQEAPKKTAQTPTLLSAEASALIPNRYETQFALPAGEYEIRVVLSDGVHFGVQDAVLTVEHYDASRLGISDVVLSRRVRKVSTDPTDVTAQVAESSTPLISKDVEYTPTANMQFWPNDTLFVYLEINDPLVAGQPGANVQANMRIVDASSGAVVDTFAPVDTATYSKAGSPVIALGRGVRLNPLPPGAYRLDVQASNAEGASTAWRSAVFTMMEAAPLELNNSPAPKKEEVILNVTALDGNQHPVTDLTGADFQLFEDNQPQAITSTKVISGRSADGTPPPIVILFDLLNATPGQREYVASRIVKVLEPLETEEGIYLYLLTNKGELYPVRPKGTMQAAAITQESIAGGSTEKKDEGPPWTKQIKPLLDQAIEKVHGFRLMEYKDVAMRAVITFDQLGQIGGQMGAVRGPKTILWVTSGVPNSILYPYGGCQDQTFHGAANSYLAGKCVWQCFPNPSDHKCLDYTPFLQHFAADAVAADTTVSSVAETNNPALENNERGTAVNTLRQLADLTGGQVYTSGNTEVEKAISETLRAARARYQIAYAATWHDGEYHKVRVVCTRGGVHIVAPQGYFAAGP
jgi:VWFA-related protein